jgi:hypothetical protein
MTAAIQTPFNMAQLELLQLFAEGVSDNEMVELRQMLRDFKFRRVSNLADNIIEANNWSAEDIATKALEMKRSTYKAKQKA